MLVWVALVLGAVAQAQPTVSVSRPDEPAHPNEPYSVTYRVSWPGDPSRYVVFPPKVASIDWGTIRLSEAESSVRDGINTVSQTVSITPVRTGDFEIPEILISYRYPEDLTPPETSAPATNPTAASVDPTLRPSPFILHVKPDRTLAWVSGGLGALLLCLMLGWWFARKRRPPTGHVSFSPPHSTRACEAHLQEAQHHRQTGQAYEFYLSLHRALEVCPVEAELMDRINTRVQGVGYQGIRPAEEEMSSDFEAVRTALERK